MLLFKFKSIELMCRTFPRMLNNKWCHRYVIRAAQQYAFQLWQREQEGVQ